MKNWILIAVLASGAAFAATPASKTPGFTATDDLPARIEGLRLKPQAFFYAPKSRLDRTFHETGLLHHWQMYQKSDTPDAKAFKGYIIFSDPYQRAQKRISFLLGSDCSNFVHRFYQMIGAEFPFAKTRHWIHLSRALGEKKPVAEYYRRQNASSTPIDLKLCEWEGLAARFQLIAEGEPLQVGDLVIYPKSEGILGTKGHMGFVSKLAPEPMVLQSKYPIGISELPVGPGERYFLRWKGGLKPIQAKDVAELLGRSYTETAGERCSDPGKSTEGDSEKGP